MVWISSLPAVQTAGMNTQQAIEAFKKMAEYSHAYGYSSLHTAQSAHAEGCNSKATGFCSHVEGSSSLHKIQPTVVEEALEKYSSSHEVSTTDELEKIRKEIEEWLKEPGINCQANIVDIDK